MDYQAVIPEFVVSDIEKSRHFYCDLLGFSVEYERSEEKFLFLSLEDCQLMLEEGSVEELAQLTYPSGAVSIFPLALKMSLSSTKNCWKLTILFIVRWPKENFEWEIALFTLTNLQSWIQMAIF